MDDLIAFVNARLDEDEAAAKAARGVEWDWRYVAQPFGERPSIAHTVHIARHDPERVLREVAAKRAILAAYEQEGAQPIHRPDPEVLTLIEARLDAYEDAVLALAAIWSDHPDYRQEWAQPSGA